MPSPPLPAAVRFQISLLLDAAETTVSQAPVYWASALLWACLDFVVALPCGAYYQHFNTLVEFWNEHPEARVALERWYRVIRVRIGVQWMRSKVLLQNRRC